MNFTPNHPKAIEEAYHGIFEKCTDEQLVEWHNNDIEVEQVSPALMIKMGCLYAEMARRSIGAEILFTYNQKNIFTGYKRQLKLRLVQNGNSKVLMFDEEPAALLYPLKNTKIFETGSRDMHWASRLGSFPELNGKKFKVLENDYPDLEMPASVYDVVTMADFCRIEPDRIPLLCFAAYMGIRPNPFHIPGFFNGNKLYARHLKWTLSGVVVGVGIYRMREGDLTLITDKEREVVFVPNEESKHQTY